MDTISLAEFNKLKQLVALDKELEEMELNCIFVQGKLSILACTKRYIDCEAQYNKLCMLYTPEPRFTLT